MYSVVNPAPVRVNVPTPVTGLLDTVNADGADKPTFVTPLLPPGTVAHSPSCCKNCPALPPFRFNVITGEIPELLTFAVNAFIFVV